jgi:hypothetical protein
VLKIWYNIVMTKIGRPSEFKEEYIAKADEYLELSRDTENENGKLKVKLPTIEGFSLFLDVNKTSLYEWEKINPDFSNALDKIRKEQHDRLINNGLSNDYNSTIAKLVLSSNHGYKEKSDVTSNDEKIQSVNVKIINGTQSTSDTDISEELPSEN